jgi:hypothetical protein
MLPNRCHIVTARTYTSRLIVHKIEQIREKYKKKKIELHAATTHPFRVGYVTVLLL